MLKEGIHIDNLFQNVANVAEEKMPVYSWDIIKERLEEKKKRRIIIIFRGMAASIALIATFFAGYYLSSSKQMQQNMLSVSTTLLQASNHKLPKNNKSALTIIKKKNPSPVYNRNNTNKNLAETSVTKTSHINTVIPDHINIIDHTKDSLAVAEDLIQTGEIITDSINDALKKIKIKEQMTNISDQDIIHHPDNKEDNKEEMQPLVMNTSGKWTIGGDISSGVLTSGMIMRADASEANYNNSLYLQAGSENIKSTYEGPISTYSACLSAKYKVKKRISVQSGLSYTLFKNSDGFFEIPLTLHYRILDRKLGVESYIGTGNGLINSGIEASFNSSTIIGVSAEYKLTDKINIMVSPIYKYMLPFNNNYINKYYKNYFGVNTGLFYKF